VKANGAVRIVAFVVALSLVTLGVVGCGGGAATTSGPAGQTTQPGSNQSTAAAQATPAGIKPIQLPKKFEPDRTTPQFFKEALERKQPIVVFFYNENDTVSEGLRESLREISRDPKYAQVIFLALDASRPDLVFGLAEPLGANYTPFIAILDSEGVIRTEYPGYVDRQLLEQAIYEVAVGSTQ